MPPLCGVNEKMLAEALKSVDELKRNRRLVRVTCFKFVPYNFHTYIVILCAHIMRVRTCNVCVLYIDE